MAGIGDRLTIHLLGAPEVRMAGVSLALHHQKARALLYYLAATARPHTRDHLAALLWGESPESNARHSLRSSLYHMRQALQAQGVGEVVTGDSDLIYLRLNDEACDVLYFRHLCTERGEEAEQALAKALALYHGPFLQGFMIADAPLFEEWQRFERHALEQMCLAALQRLVSWTEERQDWQQAIAYAQRIVQIEPLAEEMQQRLIRLYLQTEAIGQALRQYHQFEADLRHELGIAPSPETQALLSTALTIRPGAHIQSRHAHRSGRTGPLLSTPQALPFVGRDEEFEKLLAISQAVATGRGSSIVIEGEDGIGRSRLLNEMVIALQASEPSWLILQGSCSPFDDLLSYGPFLEAFQHASSGDLTGLLSPAWEIDVDNAGEQKQFLWKFLQAVQMLTRTTPLLLTIEDLQWANGPTLHLFGFLATRLRSLPVLLVGTTQRIEAIPALHRLLTLGRRHGDAHLFALSPLSAQDVSILTSHLGIGPASDAWTIATFSDWLYERSSGSPFILAEIIAQLQAEGILTSNGEGPRLDMGRWRRWRATFALPETTHDLVTWRLTNLSSDARTVLDVLAVANLPLPFKLLSEFPGIQSEQLLNTVESLEARGLVIETGKELLALPHNLLRETLLHQLSQLRRQDMHRQLARIIEQCPALQKQFPARQVALHAVAGEDSERARRYGLRILDEMVQDNANAQTATFLRHLYDLLAQTIAPDEMLRLTSALGRVHQSIGQLEEAADWHRRHLELARSIADLPAQASAHFELGELALVANDYQAAVAAARAGLAIELSKAHPSHVPLIARGHRLLGAALAMEGSDLPLAEQHLQESVAAHRRTDNMSDLCATLFELGNVAAQRGELRQALERYQEAARTAESAHVYYFLALAQNNFAYHSLLVGHLEDARQALEAGKRLAERYELFGALMHLSSTQGEFHLYLGEWQAAAEAFHASLEQAEELRNLERQAGNKAGLALAERGWGNREAALAFLEEALALIAERGYWHLRTRIQLWLAETLLLGGNFSQAELHLKAALATARAHNRKLLLLQGELLSAQLLAARGDWSAANALFAQILDRAAGLDLPLEIARVKAAWGQAMIRYTSPPREGLMLISDARQILASCDARAELQMIEDSASIKAT